MVDHHLGLNRYRPLEGFGINQGQRHFGHSQRLALASSGKDHVLHVCAAQGFGALFAQHPAHPVQNVRLAAAVWSHHHGNACSRHAQFRPVAKAFEAEDVDLL